MKKKVYHRYKIVYLRAYLLHLELFHNSEYDMRGCLASAMMIGNFHRNWFSLDENKILKIGQTERNQACHRENVARVR